MRDVLAALTGRQQVLRFSPLILMALLCGACAVPPGASRALPASAGVDSASNAKVFDRVWRLIDERYYDATFRGVDWHAMKTKHRPAALAAGDIKARYRVLTELAAELHDRHVHALSPAFVRQGRTLHWPDIGIRYRKVEGAWVVTNVVPNSPAERSGVQSGWLIISRDGLPLPDDEAAEFLTFRADRPMAFVFADEHDHVHHVNLVPEVTSPDPWRFVSTEMPGGGRYLRFDYFDAKAVGWLNRELEVHRNAPSLILDLRHNVGGDGNALRRIVRSFFPQRQRLGKTINRSERARNLDSFNLFSSYFPGRVVVLTSNVTSSSAEIFSHAMQFHRRATIVGERTSGLVVGAFYHRLPDGGYLAVAELDFIGLDGRRLEGVGVEPDIPINVTLRELRGRRDEVLEVATARLREVAPPDGR